MYFIFFLLFSNYLYLSDTFQKNQLFLETRKGGRTYRSVVHVLNSERGLYEDLHNNREKFVKYLKERVTNERELSRNERDDLAQLLRLHISHSSGPILSNIILNGGTIFDKNSIDVKNTKKLDYKVIVKQVKMSSNGFTAEELTNTIIGLARFGISWNQINDDNEIGNQLNQRFPTMNAKMLGDLMYGLGLMGAKWSDFQNSFQNQLLSSLQRNIQKFTGHSLASTIWSLGKMGTKWSMFPADLRKDLIHKIQISMKDFSPQQSSKVIWALGNVGATIDMIPLLEIVEKSIVNVNTIKRSKIGNAISQSQTMTGIAKLGINWNQMNNNVQKQTLELFERICISYNSKGISNAIWALGSIGFSNQNQSPSFRSTLFDGVNKITNDSTAWALCNTIWGLAKMGYEWTDLPKYIRESILINLNRVSLDMNSIDLGVLLWSLGKMDTPVDSVAEIFQILVIVLARELPNMKAQDLASAVWGMSMCGIAWDELPLEIRWAINCAMRRACKDMSIPEVAYCAQGLACMCFDSEDTQEASFRGCHEALIAVVRKAEKVLMKQSPTQESEQIRIFSLYVQILRHQDDPLGLPLPFNLFTGLGNEEKEKKKKHNEIYKYVNERETPMPAAAQVTTMSRLQENVVDEVERALAFFCAGEEVPLILEPEFSPFDGLLPVDAVIYRGDEIEAFVEVDGPHHYRRDGSIRRKDLMKEAMYRKIRPQSAFHRIKWSDARDFGAKEIGTKFAQIIINDIRKKIDSQSVSGRLRSATDLLFNQIQKGFSWSLRNDLSL